MKKVLYLQYTNPAAYPPLEHSSQILARDGWQVLFLGVKSRATAELKFPVAASIKVRLMKDSDGGWRQKLHYLRFVCWSMYWMLRWRPDWIYASDLFSCPVALILSFIPGLQVIYHEHDLHSPEGPSLFVRLSQRARTYVAERSEACILPNEGRAQLFKAQNPLSNVECVWNCPMRDEVLALGIREKGADFWLLYQGSIGPSKLPQAVLHALQDLPPDVKLRVIGYETSGYEGYVAEFRELASALSLNHRVQFLGPSPRHELLKWTLESATGLAFVASPTNNINMRNMVGASNKAFDYLAAGLPILVTDLDDWKTSFVTPGYAVACNQEDPQSLAAAIRWLHAHPAEAQSMGAKGRQRILADWNYEKAFAPVLKLMNAQIGTSPLYGNDREMTLGL